MLRFFQFLTFIGTIIANTKKYTLYKFLKNELPTADSEDFELRAIKGCLSRLGVCTSFLLPDREVSEFNTKRRKPIVLFNCQNTSPTGKAEGCFGYTALYY